MKVKIHDFVPNGDLFNDEFYVRWRYETALNIGDKYEEVNYRSQTYCDISKANDGGVYVVGTGVAICHENDVYDKREGRQKAFARAVIDAFPLFYEDPLKKEHVKYLLFALNLELKDWYTANLIPTGRQEKPEFLLNKLRRRALWNWFHSTINSSEK